MNSALRTIPPSLPSHPSWPDRSSRQDHPEALFRKVQKPRQDYNNMAATGLSCSPQDRHTMSHILPLHTARSLLRIQSTIAKDSLHRRRSSCFRHRSCHCCHHRGYCSHNKDSCCCHRPNSLGNIRSRLNSLIVVHKLWLDKSRHWLMSLCLYLYMAMYSKHRDRFELRLAMIQIASR